MRILGFDRHHQWRDAADVVFVSPEEHRHPLQSPARPIRVQILGMLRKSQHEATHAGCRQLVVRQRQFFHLHALPLDKLGQIARAFIRDDVAGELNHCEGEAPTPKDAEDPAQGVVADLVVRHIQDPRVPQALAIDGLTDVTGDVVKVRVDRVVGDPATPQMHFQAPRALRIPDVLVILDIGGGARYRRRWPPLRLRHARVAPEI
jgi:hypothetical protein